METIEQAKLAALITAITLSLISIGIPIVEGMNIGDALVELDGFYICDVIGADSIKAYSRLSGTEYTAYPYMDSNIGRKYCKTIVDDVELRGIWHTLEDYADQEMIDPFLLLAQAPEAVTETIIEKETIVENTETIIQNQTIVEKEIIVYKNGISVTGQWSCSPTECVEIES